MQTMIEVPDMSSVEPLPVEDEQAGSRTRLSWKLLVPLVTAGAGLMFAMSFSAAQGSDLRSDRDLTQLILERNEHVVEEAIDLDRLQREVDVLSEASAPSDDRVNALTKAADALATSAAATKLSGPGLTVSLTDAPLEGGQLPDGATPDDVVVHQQDVQAVVNALWAAGADGMMIQDQRIISTSAVRCVGNTLILQGRVYAPPYVITAIGDPDALEASLDADPTIAVYKQWVDYVGLGYDVQRHDSVELPAFSGSVDLEYAQAVR
ncbi:MAG TPA: DUF881 domain-containing protein [Dermatophilaceae bacterium]|nr:DUF881 domain-containing protein [Dermatophilaceae bacterium]